jgi:hypothetical protein
VWNRIVLACLLSSAAPGISRAYVCSIVAKKDVNARVQESDVIFRGTVTKLDWIDALPPRNLARRIVATFQVADRWKGPAAPLIRIFA